MRLSLRCFNLVQISTHVDQKGKNKISCFLPPMVANCCFIKTLKNGPIY